MTETDKNGVVKDFVVDDSTVILGRFNGKSLQNIVSFAVNARAQLGKLKGNQRMLLSADVHSDLFSMLEVMARGMLILHEEMAELKKDKK